MASPSTASSRRNSTATTGGSRRGSLESEGGGFPFRLKKSKPTSQVKIVFMGKPLELIVPMNDIDIYDGETIDGSMEAKSKNNWVQIFDMIDLTFNNLQQQNKELKRTVNELSSKVNKMVFHERKEESKISDSSKPKKASVEKKPAEYNQGQVQEINKKVDGKIQRVEENILQWIDEETKVLKDNLDKDIHAIRSEVDTKNVELNAKVQASIHDLREEVIEKVTVVEHKIIDSQFENSNDFIMNDTAETETAPGTQRAIVDLKNKLHQNCNTLRFLCSEPLSVQFSMWNKNEMMIPRGEDDWRCLCFNWINCNVGGAIDDDGVSDLHTVIIPISGAYLLSLGTNILNNGAVILREGTMRNNKEKLLEGGRTDIVELNEDDELRVFGGAGTKVRDVSLMGMLLRPRIFMTPGTTF